MSKKKSPIVVLHAVSDELRVALAQPSGGRWILSDPCCLRCGRRGEEISALRDEVTLDALAEHVADRGWEGYEAFCLLGGSSVACHWFEMPPLTGAALRQAVQIKLAQQLHFDADAAIVDVRPASGPSRNPEQSLVQVTAAHGDTARTAVYAAERAGLHLTGITANSAAIARQVRDVFSAKHGLQAMLHFDEQVSTLVVLNGEHPCVTTELPLGLADLSAALMRPIIAGADVIQLEEERATTLRDEVGIPEPDQVIGSLNITGDRLLPLIEPVLQKLTKQLTQWMTFAVTTAGAGGKVAALKIVGPGAGLRRLAESLAVRLSMDVEAVEWTQKLGGMESGDERLAQIHSVGLCGVSHRAELPDLMPPAIRNARRVARIRRILAINSSCVAAGVLLFTMILSWTRGDLNGQLAARQAELSKLQAVVAGNAQWGAMQSEIKRIQGQFDAFTQANPLWTGLFKEISLSLPAEVQAMEFFADQRDSEIFLVVRAQVYTSDERRSFGEIVEQTQRMLQRSPFVEKLELLNANTETRTDNPHFAGTLELELGLSYRKDSNKA